LINKDNYKKILKIGEIKPKELMEYFGNEAQKKRYSKIRKICGNTMEGILNNSKKFCIIEKIKRGTYTIISIHEKAIDVLEKESHRNKEYKNISYDKEYDKKKGVYSIILENKIYIGSTIRGFRDRHRSYCCNKDKNKGQRLYNEGGIIDILWSTDSSDELEIRLKEIEYIDYYNLHTDYIVVNKADNVFTLKDKNKLIDYNKILIRDYDYEKVLDLLKKEKILYK